MVPSIYPFTWNEHLITLSMPHKGQSGIISPRSVESLPRAEFWVSCLVIIFVSYQEYDHVYASVGTSPAVPPNERQCLMESMPQYNYTSVYTIKAANWHDLINRKSISVREA